MLRAAKAGSNGLIQACSIGSTKKDEREAERFPNLEGTRAMHVQATD
jgi:hypothetical protein